MAPAARVAVNGEPPLPSSGAAPADPSPVAPTAEQQIAAEAALGRALMMVQRMEEDARARADQVTVERLAAAEQEAQSLVAQAHERAAAIAEITRDSVARVLAEDYTALLEGLTELAQLEQRLRTTVTNSHERVTAVLQDQYGGRQPDAVPVPPTPPATGIGAAVGAAAMPEPMGDLDLDAPVKGADDAFFADLRSAVDGSSSIAGRAGGSVPPATLPATAAALTVANAPAAHAVPTVPGPSGSSVAPSVALAAAAAAATQAVVQPEPMTQPVPTVAPPALRVVPPMAPPGSAPPPAPARPVSPEPVFVPPAVDPHAESPEPSSRRSRAKRRRSRWAMVGTGLRNLGVLLLLFVVFQLWGTAALEHRDQARLQHSFQVAVASQPSQSSSVASGDPSTVTTPTTVAAPPAAPSGEAVAVIKIPKVGVEQAVVEGTGVSDLRKGPGHYRNTPLPGQPGNAAIAGHRTTYGAPFNRIDELTPGDAILVTTLQGNFKYIVSEAPFPVSPSQNDVLFPKEDNRLTLTTCHPKFSAQKRLIVVAKLAPRVTPAAAPKVRTVTKASVANDTSTSGDSGAALPALFWAAMVGAAYLGMVWLSRHWVRRAAFLVGVPIVLALLFPFFEQLSRFLPANY